MQQGNHSLPESTVPLTTTYPSLHRDYGVAVRGGISAFLTTNIACAFWILSGWKMGFMVAEMAAITACILTFLDDPVPALKIFIRSSIYAAILVFIYAYGIFPHITAFWELAVVLAPFIMFCVMLYLHPPLHALGLPLIMSTIMGLNLQNRYLMDQITFFDASIATVIGPIITVCIMQMVRSMSPEMTVKRMLALHYKAMRESIAMSYGTGFRIHLRSMLDRIGVLNTKLIQSEQLKIEINNALIESSAAIDLTRLQELVQKLSPESTTTSAIVKLQRLLNQWLNEKAVTQPDDNLRQALIQQFDQVLQYAQAVGDQDIRQRIEISVNNIRNSICHIHLVDAQPSTVLVGA
jgi:uncharacterized membrane protein YccC